MNPPSRFDSSERQFHGLTYRQVAILATAGLVALACLVGLKSWALWIRIGLVIACVGLSLFWAFWTDRVHTLEGLLADVVDFYRRGRRLQHRSLRETDQGKVAWPGAKVAEKTTPRPASRTITLDWRPGVLWITANTLGISILGALTLWLLQGGAHQLELIWSRL